MSYILDALKKAERERDLAKVPTLASVHETHQKQHNRWKAATAVAAAILAVGLGAYLLLPPGKNRPETKRGASGSEITPSATGRSDSEIAPVPEAAVAVIPGLEFMDAGSRPIASDLPSADYMTGGRRPVTAAATTGSRDVSPFPPREESPGPAASISPQPSAAGTLSGGHVDSDPPAPSAAASNYVSPPAAGLSPASSLMQSIGGMTLSILMYADNPPDRLVFINGRKYVEGDYVDGRFLVESITRDGAVLSCEGERATLKAAAY